MTIDFNAMGSDALKRIIMIAAPYMSAEDIKKVWDRIAFLEGWTNTEYRI